MNDIASYAGVSRQTLYVHFKSKDEMLAAAMQHVIDDFLEKLETQWSQCGSLEEQLTAYFEIAIFTTYDFVAANPDAKEIVRGVGDISAAVARDAEETKIRRWTELLATYEEALIESGSSAHAVAKFIVSTGGNLIYNAESRKDLKTLLQTLKQSVIALTRSG